MTASARDGSPLARDVLLVAAALAALVAFALPASAGRADVTFPPQWVVDRVKAAIANEDEAAQAVKDGRFKTASTDIESAIEGFRRIDGLNPSSVTPPSGVPVYRESNGLRPDLEQALHDAWNLDASALDRTGEGARSADRALALLAKARAAKEAVLNEIEPAVVEMKVIDETVDVPFVPTQAPETIEYFDGEYTTTSPIIDFKPTTVDAPSSAIGGVVAPTVGADGKKALFDVQGVILFPSGSSVVDSLDWTMHLNVEAVGTLTPVGQIHTKEMPVSRKADIAAACTGWRSAHGSIVRPVTFGRERKTPSTKSNFRQLCETLETQWSPPRTTPTTTTAPAATYSCNGQIEKIFSSFTGGAALNGAAAPSFTTNGAYCLTSIQTYHWNGGNGKPPGTLGLTHVSGPAGFASVGPFKAVGSAGQNNAPNVNWQANTPTAPTPTVIDGTYKCSDSDPATWSGDTSGSPAFCTVWGIPAQSH